MCPSHIPLVQYFNYANGVLAEQERQRRKNERVRTLAEAHALRVESLERAKKEARAAKLGDKAETPA